MATISLAGLKKKLSAAPFKGYALFGSTFNVSLDYVFDVTPTDEFRNIGSIELKYQSGKLIITSMKFVFVYPTDFIIEDDMIGINPALAVIEAALGTSLIDIGVKPVVGFIIEDDLIGI